MPGSKMKLKRIGNGVHGQIFLVFHSDMDNNIEEFKVIKKIPIKELGKRMFPSAEFIDNLELQYDQHLEVISKILNNNYKQKQDIEFYQQFEFLSLNEALARLDAWKENQITNEISRLESTYRIKLDNKVRREHRILKILDMLADPDLYITNNNYEIHMRFYPGQTLEEKVKHLNSFSEAKAIAISIIECLEKIHAAQIIHCDLKPQNIIINNNNVATIIDLGEAIIASHSIKEPMHFYIKESTVGTSGYIAPEVTGLNSYFGGVRRGSIGNNTQNLRSLLKKYLAHMLEVNNNFVEQYIDINNFFEDEPVAPEEKELLVVMADAIKKSNIINISGSLLNIPALISYSSDMFSLGKTLQYMFAKFDFSEDSELSNLLNKVIAHDPRNRISLPLLKENIAKLELSLSLEGNNRSNLAELKLIKRNSSTTSSEENVNISSMRRLSESRKSINSTNNHVQMLPPLSPKHGDAMLFDKKHTMPYAVSTASNSTVIGNSGTTPASKSKLQEELAQEHNPQQHDAIESSKAQACLAKSITEKMKLEFSGF